MRVKSKHSTNDHSHPYLRIYFWLQPENQFWEKEGYSERGKEYHRNRIRQAKLQERSLTLIDPKMTAQ